MRGLAALALLALMAPAALAGTALPFDEVALDVGLRFVHAGYHHGPQRDKAAFYEATGGGACWGDFDRDGRVDVYFTDYLDPELAGASRLFRNAGPDASGAWRFEDVTAAQGVGLRAVAQACVWGDFDNDGWSDLFVTAAITPYSPRGNALYRNLGEGRGFEDVTATARVGGDATSDATPACAPAFEHEGREIGRCWSVGAAWIDHDLDGDLDLYVAAYAEFPLGTCIHEFRGNPIFCRGQANRLYRNEGDGTFTDVGLLAGVAYNGQATLGRSLAVIASDIDGDAWPDLYVANDKDANALYLNARDGTFRSVASEKGVDNHGPIEGDTSEHRAGMGIDAQDLDNDGLVDLVSTHLRGEYDGLYLHRGDRWEDVAAAYGLDERVGFDVSRWGVAMVDLDLDGWKDMVVVAGGQARTEAGPVHLLLHREGRLAWQDEDAWPWVARDRANHRGAYVADFDDDGDHDVLVTALPSWDGHEPRAKLLRSGYADGTRTWLRVDLEGTDNARDAYGARVTVRTEDGLVQHQWKASGGSYVGDDDPRLLFGLAGARRGDLTVTWPGGATQGPVPFEVDERGGATVRVVEESRRAPGPVAWARLSGSEVAWARSSAADFAAYVVRVDDAPPREVRDRDATRLALDGPAARVLVTVVDAGGLASEARVASLETKGAPGAPVGALLVLCVAVALARRAATQR